MGKCHFHNTEHPEKILKEFTEQCHRLGIIIGDRCPIQLVMESPNKLKVLQPDYQLFNKLVTEVPNWPRNVDLLMTCFPATEKEGFTKGLAGYVANKAYNSLNNNTLAYVMVSSFKEEKVRPFSIVDIFTSAGFKFIDTIIWVKNKFVPTQGTKRLNNVFDYVFMFSKGDSYHLNRGSVAYLKNQSIPDCDEEYLCPGNVWKIKIDDRDVTPVELFECLIKLSNLLPNSLIVDPFMNAGSTLRAALQLEHSFWGCEPDKNNFKKCKKIIEELKK
jgi:hypothetical protein